MPNPTKIKHILYSVIGVALMGIVIYLLVRPFFDEGPLPPAPLPKDRVTGRISPLSSPLAAPQLTPTPTPAFPLPAGELDQVPAGTLTKLTDFPIIGPSLNKKEDRVVFYKKEGGDLFSSDFLGKAQEKISNITIVGLMEARWSPLRDRAAVFYLDQETTKGFLHIGTSTVATLPQNIRSFSWSPDGKLFAFLVPNNNLLNLVIADAGGKGQRIITATPLRDALLSWVTSDKFSLTTAPSGLAEGFIFLYSRASGILQKARGPLTGLTGLWAPDGDSLVVSFTARGGRNLATALVTASGEVTLRFPAATLPEKCIWATSKELFCAVPRVIPPNVMLPDAYLRGEFNTTDTIVRFDTQKQGIEELFNKGNFDITNLLVAKKGDFLFFVNRADGTLWSYKIK